MIEVPAPTEGAALRSQFDAAAPDRARLFAVLEGRAPGRILADRAWDPSWLAVRSSWFGRVFFAGDLPARTLAEIIGALREDGTVLLDSGDPLSGRFPPGAVETLPRLEFCRPLTGGAALRRLLRAAPGECEICRIDHRSFESCRWRDELVSVFRSAEGYAARSLGFGLFVGATLACEAHAFFWGGALVEIGVITAPEYRGRRYAAHTAAHLIAACEDLGYTTYWGCDVSNPASVSVARQLGYGRPQPYALVSYPAKSPER